MRKLKATRKQNRIKNQVEYSDIAVKAWKYKIHNELIFLHQQIKLEKEKEKKKAMKKKYNEIFNFIYIKKGDPKAICIIDKKKIITFKDFVNGGL